MANMVRNHVAVARSRAAVSASPCRIGSGSSRASIRQVIGRPVSGSAW